MRDMATDIEKLLICPGECTFRPSLVSDQHVVLRGDFDAGVDHSVKDWRLERTCRPRYWWHHAFT